MPPRLPIAAIAIGVVMAAPAISAAAMRYTSPTGAGVACTQAAPCSLSQGLAGASDGDEVRLTRDEYTLASDLEVAHSVTLSGPEGVYSRSAFWSYLLLDPGKQILILAPNVRFERLAIVGTTNGASVLVGAGSSNSGFAVNRVKITQNGTASGLLMINGTLTNTLIRLVGSSGSGVEMTGLAVGNTILSSAGRAISDDENWHTELDCSLTVRNTLATGAARNLNVVNTPGPCTPTADVGWSWVPTSGTGGGYFPALPNAFITRGASNVPDTPSPILDSAYFDSTFELQPGSSGVNAGAPGLAAQSEDLYGRPRPIGAGPDVGAIETILAPSASAVTPSRVTAGSVRLTGTVNPDFADTTYRFQYRAQGAAAWSETTTVSAGAGAADVAVDADVGGLAAGTTYAVRLVAANEVGTTTGAEATFTTAAAPAADGPVAPGTLTASWSRARRVVTARVSLFAGATGYRMTATRTKPSAATRAGRCIGVNKRVSKNGPRVKSQRCSITLAKGTWVVTAEGRKGPAILARSQRTYTVK